jgi:osmotically-inducible protein OsmY
MKSDVQIRADIAVALRFSRLIRDGNISIAASDGVVTLGGTVPSYLDLLAAERAVRAISGVRALAQEISVELPEAHVRDDGALTYSVADALLWHVTLGERLRATVAAGAVTLEGDVDWTFQAAEAIHAVSGLQGVVCVIDRIVLKRGCETPRPSITFAHAA